MMRLRSQGHCRSDGSGDFVAPPEVGTGASGECSTQQEQLGFAGRHMVCMFRLLQRLALAAGNFLRVILKRPWTLHDVSLYSKPSQAHCGPSDRARGAESGEDCIAHFFLKANVLRGRCSLPCKPGSGAGDGAFRDAGCNGNCNCELRTSQGDASRGNHVLVRERAVVRFPCGARD